MTEGAGGVLSRDALIGLDSYWRIRKFDYAGGTNIIYQGAHYTHTVEDSDSTWAIWKLTYTDDNITQIEGPLTGSWTGRALLGWL